MMNFVLDIIKNRVFIKTVRKSYRRGQFDIIFDYAYP